MLTITKEEFKCICCDVRDAYRRSVEDFLRKSVVGADPCLNSVEEISLYADALSTWEQDTFTYLGHENYLDDEGVRNIYNRVRKLQGI